MYSEGEEEVCLSCLSFRQEGEIYEVISKYRAASSAEEVECGCFIWLCWCEGAGCLCSRDCRECRVTNLFVVSFRFYCGTTYHQGSTRAVTMTVTAFDSSRISHSTK